MMIGIAQAMTEAEIEAATAYFSSKPWTRWVTDVETATVPTTQIRGGIYLKREGVDAGVEAIGDRIIEMPEDAERADLLRDPRAGLIACAYAALRRTGAAWPRVDLEGCEDGARW